jgi:hypothetical protein
MRLFRTSGTGTYVLEKVGASRVTHVASCPNVIDNLPRFQEQFPGEDPEDEKFHFCDPHPSATFCCVPEGTPYDITALLVEKDRLWARSTNSAATVIKFLTTYRDGAPRFDRPSVQLLEQAADLDEHIRRAYLLAESVIV